MLPAAQPDQQLLDMRDAWNNGLDVMKTFTTLMSSPGMKVRRTDVPSLSVCVCVCVSLSLCVCLPVLNFLCACLPAMPAMPAVCDSSLRPSFAL